MRADDRTTATTVDHPSVELFGCRVAALTLDESVDLAERLIRERVSTHHVGLNAAAVLAMRDDPRLARISAAAGFVNADGQSVVWASRVLGRRLPERVAGIDMFLALIERAASRGHRVFLLGTRQEVIERTCEALMEAHPDLVIAGSHHGYFADEESGEIARSVRESGAGMLFVGMSTPRKELWISEHLAEVGAPFCMGVGGTFDVVSGSIGRAPLWMQRSGLEWLHRLFEEPRRMWRRYLIGNVRFLFLVARERLRMGRVVS